MTWWEDNEYDLLWWNLLTYVEWLATFPPEQRATVGRAEWRKSFDYWEVFNEG